MCVLGIPAAAASGHGLDIAFRGVPGVTVVAVSTRTRPGARKPERSGAFRAYVSYEESAGEEDPDIAAIGLRWLDQRVAMARAISQTRAHVLMEKAFAATLEDADILMRAFSGRKVQVCHTRGQREPREAIRLIRDRRHRRGWNCAPRQGGSPGGREDMLTLGTHCFDAMRMILGDRCAARRASRAPEEAPRRRLPHHGDAIDASFEFVAAFPATSLPERTRVASARYGVTVFGSKGAVAFPLNDIPNPTWISQDPSWRGPWAKIEPPGGEVAASHPEVNTLMAEDLLAAIEEDRNPLLRPRRPLDHRDGASRLRLQRRRRAGIPAAGGAETSPNGSRARCIVRRAAGR